ncbi:MAG: ferrous iron transport protein B [Bacteriovoracaceae bacterium]|nr:ferrous iron transport protein B [Bacteriovoracaceae bacterium]
MKINVAIAGNPNSGKTTLFNSLAGTNYHVANYPGVTVEKKTASITYNDSNINFVDLPGTYSLTAYSLEEKVARDYIIHERPDIIVQVLDASNIERNLYLTVQLLELGVPVIIALNMMDVATKRDISIDEKILSEKIGLPVIRTIARKDEGSDELLQSIVNCNNKKASFGIDDFSYGEDIDCVIGDMVTIVKKSNFLKDNPSSKWVALKYIENDEQVINEGKKNSTDIHNQLIGKTQKLEKHIRETLNTYPEAVVADHRYGIVSSLLKNVVSRKTANIDRIFISDRIDQILTQRLVGPLVLLGILYFSYQFTFWASEHPAAWMESFFGFLASVVDNNLSDGLLKSLIVSGIIDGIGGVLGFAPLIMFMFFVIAILEDSGYMARIAYILDRLFRFFGLQGSSVLPYVVSGGIAGGCAVPGVMAARTIKGQKERLLTILTAPFMACGAKLPVFALLISAFFPGDKSLLLVLVTLMSWLSALIVAKIMGSTIVKGNTSSFIMELPPYRFPTLKGLLLHSWERTWMYIKKAGTVILAISIVLWMLMTFPQLPDSKTEIYESQRSTATANYSDNATMLKKELAAINNMESQEALRNSIAGRVGIFIEPVSKYAGFDWRTNIALIGGIAAKEVVISTLGTAYSMGETDPEEIGPLSEKLSNDPSWDIGVALALIFFTILYAPCFVTVVVISRETGSWKWGAFTVFGYTTLAYLVSVVINTVF